MSRAGAELLKILNALRALGRRLAKVEQRLSELEEQAEDDEDAQPDDGEE